MDIQGRGSGVVIHPFYGVNHHMDYGTSSVATTTELEVAQTITHPRFVELKHQMAMAWHALLAFVAALWLFNQRTYADSTSIELTAFTPPVTNAQGTDSTTSRFVKACLALPPAQQEAMVMSILLSLPPQARQEAVIEIEKEKTKRLDQQEKEKTKRYQYLVDSIKQQAKEEDWPTDKLMKALSQLQLS